ncbi:MAG: substrate-binding domain-containing protein [Flavobacteriaceae bacterium]|nr:substrate-binding domain-containing protein [Flavobacteriaceae bacterium]MBT7675567.1 substrate-binding domain-containing protein [Flavobacteriaceae bacterium]
MLWNRIVLVFRRSNGLFSITDRTAIGAMNYFKKNGLKVPEDIAVIGFSNWKVSALTSPSLSSVEQNGVKMGKK